MPRFRAFSPRPRFSSLYRHKGWDEANGGTNGTNSTNGTNGTGYFQYGGVMRPYPHRWSNGHYTEEQPEIEDVEPLSMAERQQKVKRAFAEVLHSTGYEPFLERFHFVYDYRRRLPGLLESGNFPGYSNGLAWAVYDALDLYGSSKYPNLDLPGRLPVDEAFRKSLEEAVDQVLSKESSIEDFCRALARADHNLDTISCEELKGHIASALDDYCARGKANAQDLALVGSN